MKRSYAAILLAAAGAFSCSADDAPVEAAPGDDFASGPTVDGDTPPPPDLPADDDAGTLEPTDAGTPPAPDAGPACAKKITVIFTVGVPGKSKIKGNGCWTPVIADGAAVQSYRKCSTSDYVVHNGTAPNWAYDDTSPAHPLTSEKSFLSRCSTGSTGDGYEYMAYRSGWRLLGATHLRAYFAELYTSAATDIDSLYYVSGVYRNNSRLATHTNVYPMMNFGPPRSSNLQAKVGTETLRLCKTVRDGGYFGAYNPSWREGMDADDVRLLAFEHALDKCTAPAP